MEMNNDNRFSVFYREDKYVNYKNYLYNYLLRKRAIEKSLLEESPTLILEVGSGISPVITKFKRTVYSDLSFKAAKILKQTQKTGYYVVADGMNLPFKPNGFSHIICSEVLEHLDNDLQALKEMAGVLTQASGRLIITVPHRKCYYANDDKFVNHYRRYELTEIINRLNVCGLNPIRTRKVLGPLEKATMIFVVFIFTIIQRYRSDTNSVKKSRNCSSMVILAGLFKWANLFYRGYVWLDAMMMPRSLSSVILIKSISARKK
jgi:SAM-dependent methyltransferase